MKAFLKHVLRRLARVVAGEVQEDVSGEFRTLKTGLADVRKKLESADTACAQVALFHHYRDLAARGGPLPAFTDVGFRCHSQFEEDGILLYIFALIGTTNKTCVELGAGNGIECNTANLILNHGWWGYLFDGDSHNVSVGTRFFREAPSTWLYPPGFTRAWLRADNVDQVLADAGVSGEVDLLSIDLDGMDFWIWRAIESLSPRVVVCETHNVIPPEQALAVPYDPEFEIKIPDYHSASLAAMTKLAEQKGLRLVGTHRYGFNAFFVRKGVGENYLPRKDPTACLQDPYSRYRRATGWPKVRDRDWVRI